MTQNKNESDSTKKPLVVFNCKQLERNVILSDLTTVISGP